MLILQPDPKRAILKTFYAKFGRSKFSSFAGGESERGQNDHFSAKIANLVILVLLNGISKLILHPDRKKAIVWEVKIF